MNPGIPWMKNGRDEGFAPGPEAVDKITQVAVLASLIGFRAALCWTSRDKPPNLDENLGELIRKQPDPQPFGYQP
jgi:hypothetical protein